VIVGHASSTITAQFTVLSVFTTRAWERALDLLSQAVGVAGP